MSLLMDAIGRALERLAQAAEEDGGLKKPWMLSFTAETSGVFLEPTDIEMTPADDDAEPLLALEAGGTPQEVRVRFLVAWAAVPILSDHQERAVYAAYKDSLGVGTNEGGAGWSWQSWDEIE
jgi:hypothetical protein